MSGRPRHEFASHIELELRDPDAVHRDLERACDLCIQRGFAGLVVPPNVVRECAARLRGTAVRTIANLGDSGSPREIAIARGDVTRVVEAGAVEIEAPIHAEALLAGNKEHVVRHLSEIIASAKAGDDDVVVKAVLPMAGLATERLVLACRCIAEAQAEFAAIEAVPGDDTELCCERVAHLRKHLAPIRVKVGAPGADGAWVGPLVSAGADRVALGVATVLAIGGE